MRDEKASLVLRLFTDVSPQYDILLALLSLGRDRAWRTKVVELSRVNSRSRVLDLAAGTCLLAVDFVRRSGWVDVVGVDYSMDMLRQGKRNIEQRGLCARVELVNARTENLPFIDSSFDVVAMTLALRNVSAVDMTLREMTRVSKPGGKVVSLDFSRPRNQLFRRLYYLYLFRVIPNLGLIVSRDWQNLLVYLGHSIQASLSPLHIMKLMMAAGLIRVSLVSLTWGVVSLLCGRKPDQTHLRPSSAATST